MNDLRMLADPFPPNDIEWRIQSSGKKGDRVWARVLAYITSRAIMQRLDDVCGPDNWRNEYRYETGGAVLCGISVYNDKRSEWVTKWDGAENTDIEAVKGGLSGAMKRAGVQWGIGRYLYDLEEGFAQVSENGKHYAKTKEGVSFNWDPPKLPVWALPSGAKKAGADNASNGDARQVARDSQRSPEQSVSAPAGAPSPVSEQKADEDKKWKGKTVGERSDDQLREIMEAVKNNGLMIELHDSCRRILAKRNPDAKLNKAIAEEAAFQAELKIPA